MLQQLSRSGEAKAEDLVRAVLTRDMADPYTETVRRAMLDGAQAGCFAVVEAEGRGRIARAVKGSTEVVPVLEVFPEVGPAFESVCAGWQAFRRDRAELAAALVEKCGKGVSSRQESSSDSSFD